MAPASPVMGNLTYFAGRLSNFPSTAGERCPLFFSPPTGAAVPLPLTPARRRGCCTLRGVALRCRRLRLACYGGFLLADAKLVFSFLQHGWGTMSAFLLCAGTVRLERRKADRKEVQADRLTTTPDTGRLGGSRHLYHCSCGRWREGSPEVPPAPVQQPCRVHSCLAEPDAKGSQVRASSPLSFGARRFWVAFACQFG